MAGGAPISNNTKTTYDPNQNYSVPMTIMTALFFMIGFITVLNDVLIPSLKGVFDLQGWQAMMIQFCFFTAYFVMSPPAGYVINKVGYKKGLMVGLAVTAMGLFMFIPAANIVSYGFFLFALFTVGCGFAILQVAINPYIPLLGSPETASSRLNLGGTFNSIATFMGPIIGAWLILSIDFSYLTETLSGTALDDAIKVAKSSAVKLPYIVLGVVTILIAGLLSLVKLPEITGETVDTGKGTSGGHLDFAHLKYGAGAIFFYVGVEVAIGSLLVLYLMEPSMGGLEESLGSSLLAYYWGGAMIGRFIGFLVLKKIKAEMGLRAVTGLAFLLVLLSMFTFALNTDVGISILRIGNEPITGDFFIRFESITVPLGAFLLVLVGLCNAIMWPCIFPLGVRGLGEHTSKGSGLMVSMVLGGAIVPLIQSILAKGVEIDSHYLLGFEGIGYRFSFIVCLICYAYIFMFAVKWYKAGKVKELYKN